MLFKDKFTSSVSKYEPFWCTVNFIECHSEEVMFLLTLSVPLINCFQVKKKIMFLHLCLFELVIFKRGGVTLCFFFCLKCLHNDLCIASVFCIVRKTSCSSSRYIVCITEHSGCHGNLPHGLAVAACCATSGPCAGTKKRRFKKRIMDGEFWRIETTWQQNKKRLWKSFVW